MKKIEMRESKNDKLADKLMSELLSNRGFQKIWQEATLELATSRETPPPPQQPSGHLFEENIFDISPPIDSISAGQLIEELSSNIMLTVDNFLRSLPLALPYSEDRLNRETANLYSVRVQLDRLSNHSTHLQLPQLRLTAKRISNLLKSFSSCTSSHFPVPSCSFLASSLCDLMYRFEELCSLNEELVPPTATVRLKQCIGEFHIDVVKRLNAILLQRRPQTAATTTTSGIGTSCRSFSNLSLSPNRMASTTVMGSRVTLAPTIFFQRTPSKPSNKKSFLLSPEIEVARARLRRNRSTPSNRKAATFNEIERRWRTMLSENDNAILKSVAAKEGAESHALKAACRLTRNVVDEIARHVERL